MYTYDISSVAASVASTLDISAPKHASPAYAPIADKKVDRVLLYNPDAIALWIYGKYRSLFLEAEKRSDFILPARSVMPSVTPVCFGTMYTGASPDLHGIKKYEKPVITIETLFDSLIASGKKPCIVSYGDSSISKIFLNREMDYYIPDTMDNVNSIAMELMREDKYDLITVYNGNYDSVMHKNGPEAEPSIDALKHNIAAFCDFCDLADEVWKGKRYAAGFCPDHGCHLIDGDCGSHGLEMDEDMNVVHMWRFA